MIYLLIILALLSAWEEVQQMVQRKSWKREDYRYPEWKTDYSSIWKNFDSHHIAFGLFVVVMFYTMASKSYISVASLTDLPLVDVPLIGIAIDVVISWLGFFYVRNIGMHIIFKRQPIYSYLLFWKMK